MESLLVVVGEFLRFVCRQLVRKVAGMVSLAVFVVPASVLAIEVLAADLASRLLARRVVEHWYFLKEQGAVQARRGKR